MATRFRRWQWVAILLSTAGGRAAAQDHPSTARGFSVSAAYQVGELDHVNLYNGHSPSLFLSREEFEGPAHDFVAFPAGAPWVLGTYDRVEVDEGSTPLVSTYCFDEGTGFLKRVRTHVRGAGEAAADRLVAWTAGTAAGQGRGNVVSEEY